MALFEARLGITDLYPKTGLKPSIPSGIGPEQREAARMSLLQYYSPDSQSFGQSTDNDPFKNIHDYLEHLRVNSEIDEQKLKEKLTPTVRTAEDTRFLAVVSDINQILEKGIHTTWKTCNYRYVSAVSQTEFSIGDHAFTVGAAGSSGGHEFLYFNPNQEKDLLAEAITEAMIVSGVSLGKLLSKDQNRIAHDIKTVADIMLDERRSNDQFAWSPNCQDLTQMAVAGANRLIQSVPEGRTRLTEQDFNFCLMHKYNPQYAAKYEGANLSQPAQHGRLRCPSHCAETQALSRNEYDLVVPFFTGFKSSYLLGIGRSAMPDQKKRSRPFSQLMFLVADEKDPSGFSYKELFMDNRLTIEPFLKSSDNLEFPAVFLKLEELGIDLSLYQFLAVRVDNNILRIFGDFPDSTLRTNGQYFEINTKQIVEIPIDELSWVKTSTFSPDKLWTSALPCHHCLNQMSKGNLGAIYIDRIDWNSLKGDDGLALEALLQLPGRKVILHN